VLHSLAENAALLVPLLLYSLSANKGESLEQKTAKVEKRKK